MKITGKNWIEIIGAEGTKHPMYIKGSMEGAKEIVYLADVKTSGYVRRKVGNAWVYMHKEDVAIQKASQQTETPTTRLKRQNAELQAKYDESQAELNASQAELSASKAELSEREAEDKKKEEQKLAAKQRRLARKIADDSNGEPKETPKQTIARLEQTVSDQKSTIDALRYYAENLEKTHKETKETLKVTQEALVEVVGEKAENDKAAAGLVDQLTAEKETLKGQNEIMERAVKSIGKRVSVLADPAVAEFVDNADGAEISVHTDVKGGHIETVLRARKSIEK